MHQLASPEDSSAQLTSDRESGAKRTPRLFGRSEAARFSNAKCFLTAAQLQPQNLKSIFNSENFKF